MVFISFFNLLSSFGIGPAIVQNKDLQQNDIETIFLFSIFLGLFLALIFFFVSPFISEFYKNDELTKLSKLMSIIILLQSVRIVPEALNRKKLKFKQLGLLEVFAQTIGGIVAIILAYLGFSYYAIVLNSILSSFITITILYIMEPIKFTFSFNINSVRKIFKFSSFQFFFNFINYFARNSDNLLIGKFFSPTTLGFYDKAYRLMTVPVQNLTHVITPVLHPVLSEYFNDKKVTYNAYYKVVKLLATIGFPLSIFLFFSASEIVHIMYGPQWTESIPVFKLLALTIGIQIVVSSTGSIFQATNRTDLMFYSGMIGTFLMLSGIGYGIFIGKSLVSVGYGLVFALSFNFLQGFYLLLVYALGFSFFKFLKIFIVPFIISIFMVISLWLFSQFQIPNYIFSLLIKILISGFVFSGIIFSIEKERNFIKNIQKRYSAINLFS